ncbi:hypothetical protein U1Q18_000232, partial [Sarracenia purpurea var. burkii]
LGEVSEADECTCNRDILEDGKILIATEEKSFINRFYQLKVRRVMYPIRCSEVGFFKPCKMVFGDVRAKNNKERSIGELSRSLGLEAMRSEKTLHGEEDEQEPEKHIQEEVGGVVFEKTEMVCIVEESDNGVSSENPKCGTFEKIGIDGSASEASTNHNIAVEDETTT